MWKLFTVTWGRTRKVLEGLIRAGLGKPFASLLVVIKTITPCTPQHHQKHAATAFVLVNEALKIFGLRMLCF